MVPAALRMGDVFGTPTGAKICPALTYERTFFGTLGMEHNTERLANGALLYTGAAHPITTDALLLADFCEARGAQSVCDLGSGSGVLLLSLVDRGLTGRAVGVELDPRDAGLLRLAAAHNGFGNVQAVCGDMREYRTAHPFDVVVSNPPYHATGRVSPNARRAAARHQGSCGIGEVAATAFRLLKDGGRFYCCWPAGRLAGLFGVLAAARLAPHRMQLVRKNQAAAARLALVEARKKGGQGLAILPDLYVNPAVPGK